MCAQPCSDADQRQAKCISTLINMRFGGLLVMSVMNIVVEGYSINLVDDIRINSSNGQSKLRWALDGHNYRSFMCATGSYCCFRDAFLDKIMIPRVPGSAGHKKVEHFIITMLKYRGWNVHLDEFESETPKGTVQFTNIVAILDPSAPKKRIFSAHYDSKEIASVNGKKFVGATDSAVSVALLLDLASIMGTARGKSLRQLAVTPMLIFFDGEEAFLSWSRADSLYGSRHLATRLSKPNQITNMSDIESLILLDLVGGPRTQFKNYNRFNKRYYGFADRVYPADPADLVYKQLRRVEHDVTGRNTYFQGGHSGFGSGEDDHVPFAEQGVPCVHLISIPYPEVWHSVYDDEEHLHRPTVEAMIRVFRAYAMKMLR